MRIDSSNERDGLHTLALNLKKKKKVDKCFQ